MSVTVWTPERVNRIAERVADDFGAFAYDGWGVMLSDQQLEAVNMIGVGPRASDVDPKTFWVSGGQRAGKTVVVCLLHFRNCLYKQGLDNTDRGYWNRYQYATLNIAPTDELANRLWTIGDGLTKGANESQFNAATRTSRGGAFIGKAKAGKAGPYGVIRFTNGARVDMRSSEGKAYRLEGGQWWLISWDEWASQPDREINTVLVDVLLGRSRDHDAKIIAMAWPKPETERHLIQRIRAIESGRDRTSAVVYLDAEQAHFTNRQALALELKTKDKATIERTIRGRPAGGAGIEFKSWMIDHAVRPNLERTLREDGYAYFNSWDIGLAHDSTVNLTWRIPIVNGKALVAPEFPARVVNWLEMKGGEDLTVDAIAFAMAERNQLYPGSETAMDATSMGGQMAFRQAKTIRPKPFAFVSRANDRIHGNMRLAAIANGYDVLTWGRPINAVTDDQLVQWARDSGQPWGLIEMPRIQPLIDQLLSFDRDAKDVPDDWVWSFLIGCWYIRRLWAVGDVSFGQAYAFDVRKRSSANDPPPTVVARREARRRSTLIQAPLGPAVAPLGQVWIRQGVRYVPAKRG